MCVYSNELVDLIKHHGKIILAEPYSIEITNIY
jgi:hypothetical protein